VPAYSRIRRAGAVRTAPDWFADRISTLLLASKMVPLGGGADVPPRGDRRAGAGPGQRPSRYGLAVELTRINVFPILIADNSW